MSSSSTLATPRTSSAYFLSLDKRNVVSSPPCIPNAKIIKSVQVMKIFWGDIEDDDYDDSSQVLYSIPCVAKYLQDTTVKATRSKWGRPKKKKKSSKTRLESSSEGIKTCSKAQNPPAISS